MRRTRRALHDALIELMIEKGYEAVTVQDIIDRADVVRSTFYAHFTDKQDLLRGGIDELGAGLREACRSAESGQRMFGFTLELFRHTGQHRRLFQALMGRRGGGALVFSLFGQMITDLVREDLVDARLPQRTDPVRIEVAVQFISGELMSVLTWWLESGLEPGPAELDRMFRDLATPAVRRGLAPAW